MQPERSYVLKVNEVKRLARIAGLSDTALARKLNVHVKTLRSRWLGGKPVYRSNIVRLAEVLKTSWTALAVGAEVAEIAPIEINLSVLGTIQKRDGIFGEITRTLNNALESMEFKTDSMSTEILSTNKYVTLGFNVVKTYASDGELCWVLFIVLPDKEEAFHAVCDTEEIDLDNFQYGTVILAGTVWEGGSVPSFIAGIVAETAGTSFFDLWQEFNSGCRDMKVAENYKISAEKVTFRRPPA